MEILSDSDNAMHSKEQPKKGKLIRNLSKSKYIQDSTAAFLKNSIDQQTMKGMRLHIEVT